MDGQKLQPQIFSLNIDDLDVEELERRLEMAVANPDSLDVCGVNRECNCAKLGSCGTYC
ncbi:MAG TPA: hypothetical protein VF647_15070 [Longimicrobium sp.]|jgi:hypothetical protein